MLRLFTSVALLSLWLALLLWGWALGGAVYLLLVAGLVLFPWRSLATVAEADDGAG